VAAGAAARADALPEFAFVDGAASTLARPSNVARWGHWCRRTNPADRDWSSHLPLSTSLCCLHPSCKVLPDRQLRRLRSPATRSVIGTGRVIGDVTLWAEIDRIIDRSEPETGVLVKSWRVAIAKSHVVHSSLLSEAPARCDYRSPAATVTQVNFMPHLS
jgi:hypothetical protein